MTDEPKTPPLNGEKPRVPGREAPVLRKRVYTTVSVAEKDGAFGITLDGKPARTPGKRPLAAPRRALAEAIAAEWSAQDKAIRPTTMPLTTLACTAIDAVAEHRAAVADEIGAYAMSDLLCYHAGDPPALAERHARQWSPVLAWAEKALGVRFNVAGGLMPVAQDEAVRAAVVAVVAPLDPFRLAAMSVLTTITGSAILAIAVLRRHLDLATAWTLAHLDEDWQAERWGVDAEAAARSESRLATATAAARVLELLAPSSFPTEMETVQQLLSWPPSRP